MQMVRLFGGLEARQVKGEKRSGAGDDAFGFLTSCGEDSWLSYECEDIVAVPLKKEAGFGIIGATREGGE